MLLQLAYFKYITHVTIYELLSELTLITWWTAAFAEN